MLDQETKDLMRDLNRKLGEATTQMDPYNIAILGDEDHDGAGSAYDIVLRISPDGDAMVVRGATSVILSHYVRSSFFKNLPPHVITDIDIDVLTKHHDGVRRLVSSAKDAENLSEELSKQKDELTRLRALERSVVAATTKAGKK